MNNDWMTALTCKPDLAIKKTAATRQDQLTKPRGSLGCLEELAIRLAALQHMQQPCADKVRIVVFAGDHGVVEEGVSTYPQSVTVEMVRNFARGGAAISVLAKELNATLEVVNVGTVSDPGELSGVLDQRVCDGTDNMTRSPAMNEQQLVRALQTGRDAVNRAVEEKTNIFIGGEMGIGNTTAASAMACAILNRSAADLVGPGTGLDDKGVKHKRAVIDKALAFHGEALDDPLEALRCVGGFEIASLTGAYIACAQAGMPALVDGFIASAAALTACQLNAGVEDWLMYSHVSFEPGHRTILQAQRVTPLIDMKLRLGEGSGAAVVVPLIRLACALHNNMATFEEAGVKDKTSRHDSI